MKPVKEWSKPELIVVGKTRPEEAVLSNCKRNVSGSSGASSQNSRCRIFICLTNCSTYVNT